MPAANPQSFAELPTAAKVGLFALIIGLCSAAYYLSFHMSLSDDLEQAQNEYTRLQTSLRSAQQRQAEYLRLVEELVNREAIDRANKRILPEKGEIAAFLQDLTRSAELSGLDLTLVEPRPEEALELYSRLPVSVKLEGKFHQVARFFHNVSQLERAINLENVHLSNPKREAEEIRLQIDVLATTFRRPEAVQAGATQAQAQAGPPGRQP